jgi:hypothetical protein
MNKRQNLNSSWYKCCLIRLLKMHIYKLSNCSNGSSEIWLNQMIVDKTHHLKLSAPVSYINKVWPAFNESFVL